MGENSRKWERVNNIALALIELGIVWDECSESEGIGRAVGRIAFAFVCAIKFYSSN